MTVTPSTLGKTRKRTTGRAEAGREMHKKLALAVTGWDPWPNDYPWLAAWFAKLRTRWPDVEVEVPLAVDREGWACTFDTGFLRGYADVLMQDRAGTALLIDWKTGRKTDTTKQMEAYVYLLLANRADIRFVTAAVVWLRTGRNTTFNIARGSKEHLQLKGRVHRAVARQA